MKQDNISKNIMENYPFPIAAAYKKFVEQQNTKDKVLMILRTYEYILRYFNLLLMATNHQDSSLSSSKQILSVLDSFDHENHLSTFRTFLDNPGLQNSLVESIQQFFGSVESTIVYAKEISEYKMHDKSLNSLEILEYMEKSLVPVIALLNDEELKPYLDILQEHLHNVLGFMGFLKDYSLVWIQESHFQEGNGKYVTRVLHGIDRNFPVQELSSSHKLDQGKVYIYFQQQGTFFCLAPFIVYQDCYYCIRQEMLDTKELFLLQFATSKRLCYSGYTHEVALRECYHEYGNLWKNVENSFAVEIDEKKVWELSFQHVEDKIKEFKKHGFYSQYLPRKDIENVLDYFVNKSSYSLFYLTGEPGAGKTTLLHEMARKWSSQAKNILFVASTCNDIEGYLEHVFLCKNVLGYLANNNINLVLIIDDIEESTAIEKTASMLTHIAHKYQKNIKIIMSSSELFYFHFKKCFKISMFMPVEGKCPLIESQMIRCHVSSFPLFQGQNLYSNLVNKKLGPVTAYESFSFNLKGMLLNPVLIHVFLQALKNREVPYNLGIRDIMEGFAMNQVNANKKCRETAEKFIETLITKKKSYLEFDDAIETDEDNFIQDILNFSSHAPIIELEERDIFKRFYYHTAKEKTIGIKIPVSLVRYYLFYRSFALAGKHSDELLIEYLDKVSKKNDTNLLGVVYFALLRLADKKYFDRLMKVIKSGGDYNPFARGILNNILIFKIQCSQATIGKGNEVDELIDILFGANNNSILLALADVATKLYVKKNYSSAATLFERLSDKINDFIEEYDGLSLTLIAAKSYQLSGDMKKSLKLYKKSYKMLKKVEGTQREVDIYNFLANAHREMGDWEKVSFFIEKIKPFQRKFEGKFLEVEFYANLGFVEEKKGNHEKALEYFHLQSDKAEELDLEDKIGYALENSARIYYRQKNRKKALTLLEEALQIFTDLGDNHKIGEIKYTIAKIYKESGNAQKAIMYLLSILNIFDTQSEKNILIDIYIKLYDIYESVNKLDECKFYIDKAIHVLRETGDEKRLAKCFDKSGMLDFKNKQYKSSWDKYLKALEIYKRNHDDKGMANINNQLGILYFTQKNYDKAQKHYADSLKLYQNIQHNKGIAEVQNNIAVILAHTNKLDKALDTLLECRHLYMKVNDFKGVATAKGTEALIFKLQGQKEKSLDAYLECAKMFEKVKEKRLLGNVYNSIGLLYKEKADFHNALEYFEKAALLQDEIKDYLGLSASYNNMGLIYDAKNDYEKALQYYNKDLEITEKLGDKKGIATSYNNIAILHYNHRNYARSLWYLEKSVGLYEELKDHNMIKKIQERILYVKEKL